MNVGAVFTATPSGGGGGGGGTTGGGTTGKTLTVKTAGGKGLVTSAPAGISCGKTCAKSFATGTAVTLTAAPEPGFVFVNWTGACTGAQATCTITMNANASTQANFVKP